MNFWILSIPHERQRYNTVGDFYHLNGQTQFRISNLGNWRYEACVLVHELVEYFIVKHQGIPISKIDKFDKEFERSRKPGNTDEPGDDSNAPYRFAHCIATGVERVFAAVIGVDWKKYESKINSL